MSMEQFQVSVVLATGPYEQMHASVG